MTRLIAVVGMLFMAMGFMAGCGDATAPQDSLETTSVAPVTKEGDTLVFRSAADWAYVWNDYESLSKDADNIFTGRCLDVSTIYQNETLYTISRVRVEKVYKGALKQGSEILVGENGGRTTYGEYTKGVPPTPKDFVDTSAAISDDQKIMVAFDGFYPMQAGDDLLLFVHDSDHFYKAIEEDTYYIVGGYMGKFKRAGGFVERVNDSGRKDYPTLRMSEEELGRMLAGLGR